MSRRAKWFSLTPLLLLLPGAARAEWLELGSRAISRSESANPDAPVSGYAYGPHARASLGADLAFWISASEQKTLRLGGLALFAVDDADEKRFFPGEVARTWLALSASWAHHGAFGPSSPVELELALELGRRSALTLDGFVLSDPFRPNDVPYGAGGYYLGSDVAIRLPLAGPLEGSSRLSLLGYANAFPALVGASGVSDHTASFLEEGAELAVSLELGLRYRRSARAQPALHFFGDVIVPHDDSAKKLWLVRTLLGVALPGQRFELEPYLDAEAGHGQGLLVNRSQVRLGVGARVRAR